MEKNNTQKRGGYGVISLMAMTIGIVIGSGIFAKNAGLVGTNGSILDTMLAWTIGGILVIAILIAFLEIISITEITNEQATLANWGRHLLGAKFGNFVGYYMVFVYFPMIIAGLFCFAANQFSSTLSDLGAQMLPNASDANSALVSQITLIGVAAVIAVTLFLMNSFTSKPGRILQNVGTAIKTIPLFFLIILLVVMLIIGLPGNSLSDIQAGIDANPDLSTIDNKNGEFALILMTLPGILFAVDGFLLAGSLSKESKSESSFKTAFLFSIIFILTIYVLYSFATLALGDPTSYDVIYDEDGTYNSIKWNHGEYGGISNAIFNVFSGNESLAEGLAVTTDAIITLSMVVGISGCIITCMRMYTDLSVHNSVIDPHLKAVTKNQHGVAPISGFWVAANAISWLAIAFIFDVINIYSGSGDSMLITGYMTDLIVVGIFFIYSIIIISGLVNRFTNKVETKRNWAFIPASIVASLMTIGITSYFAYQILNPGNPGSSGAWVAWGLKLAFTLLFIGYSIGVFVFLDWRTSNLSQEFIKEKQKASAIYYGETFEETTNKSKVTKKV